MGAQSQPRIAVDWDQLELAAKYGAPATEVAAMFNMSEDTLNRRIKEKFGLTYSKYRYMCQAPLRQNLRMAQYDEAVEKRSIPMLIWLGKNWLDQTDAPKEPEQADQPAVIEVVQYREIEKEN